MTKKYPQLLSEFNTRYVSSYVTRVETLRRKKSVFVCFLKHQLSPIYELRKLFQKKDAILPRFLTTIAVFSFFVLKYMSMSLPLSVYLFYWVTWDVAIFQQVYFSGPWPYLAPIGLVELHWLIRSMYRVEPSGSFFKTKL